MKILIFIGSLQTGGAERVTSLMCNFWCEQGHEITLVTSVPLGNDFYYLDKRINRVSLGFNFEGRGVISSIIEHVSRLSKMKSLISVGKFEVVIGCTSTLAIRVAFLSLLNKTASKYVGWEHVFSGYFSGGIRGMLRRYLYSKLNSLVILTCGDLDRYSKRTNMVVIPNPVIALNNAREWRLKRKNLCSAIAVGTLNDRKGYDRMIEAAQKIHDTYNDFTLDIYGHGPRKEHLIELIKQKDAQNYVKLKGVTNNMPNILFEYDTMLMTSFNEGMPMVILESFSTGLPVIAMDCPTGPKELIGNDQYGRLVENGNIDSFAQSVVDVLYSSEEYGRLVEASFKRAEDFDINKIGQSWSKLFGE